MEKEQKAVGYTSLKERKSSGAHYTPKILADFVAQEILNAWKPSLKSNKIRLLDPAIGDGELVLAVLERLPTHIREKIEIFAFDTDPHAIKLAQARIKRRFPQGVLHLKEENFLDFALMYGNRDLFSIEPFDLIIANPPYVRTQVMGAKKAKKLASHFGLSGRVDLYYAFILGIARLLRANGVAGIIISNRFMTTKSGRVVRQKVLEELNLLHVWDLGDTKLFEAAVLPAILLATGKRTSSDLVDANFTSIYSTDNKILPQPCLNVIEGLNKNGVIELNSGQRYLVQHGKLNYGEKAGGVWRIATEKSEQWLNQVDAHTFCTFADIGKIRVGVKTTADKVFIRSDWQDMPENERPELLKPLITHHIARRFKATSAKIPKQILYTHELVNGKRVAINLANYPQSATYLNRHRLRLEKREYVLNAGRNWFEIWVPHHPTLWKQPKVVFRDIAEKPTFWMDQSGAIVNGDCYWLTANTPQQNHLLWLALAVANSSFIEMFYDQRFNNKLYAGRRRFITQYVNKFPLPNPQTDLSAQLISIAKQIYHLTPSSKTKKLEKELDQLVWRAFGENVTG